MRRVSIEDFCAHPDLVTDGAVVLTSESAAIGIVLGLHDEEVAGELELLVRHARTEEAVRRIQKRAAQTGLDSLSMDEIATARAARRS